MGISLEGKWQVRIGAVLQGKLSNHHVNELGKPCMDGSAGEQGNPYLDGHVDAQGNPYTDSHADAQDNSHEILLPGTLNGSGFGEPVSEKTEWNAGLHNPFWYEREEYKSGTEGAYHVPFLSQPTSFYSGKAVYSRSFSVDVSGKYYLFVELSKWRLSAFVDGVTIGSAESLCAPFLFGSFELTSGEHGLAILVDNGMQYPYRPDGHGISDALNANWNGMGGELLLLTEEEYWQREEEKRQYALSHPVQVTTKDGAIVIDGKAEYMRGTHFGGDFPLTGMPETRMEYWEKLFAIIKEWGFNFMRCHSFCPPEAAFLAADRAHVYIQVECGMWNTFGPENPILDVLYAETEKILRAFGHHPSFVLFSPSNEPSGDWYQVLRDWVNFARETDRKLGYEGRRLYTAQSGWYYDVPPAEVQGTDYLYFHRSAYGPRGGMLRNSVGWGGGDYRAALAGCRLPVIVHEMGQWCAYPDFSVIKKFTGYAKPGNFEIFQDSARKSGVLAYNKDFVYCSGRNQMRLLKEEFEANYRTPEITGYEYLDLHDYTGQGTALVGVLDAFWENKGYTTPEEFRQFNSEIVVLARIRSYVLKGSERFTAWMEIANFSSEALENMTLLWQVTEEKSGIVLASGKREQEQVPAGRNTELGEVSFDFAETDWKKLGEKAGFPTDICFGRRFLFSAKAISESGAILAENAWKLTVFVQRNAEGEALEEKISERETLEGKTLEGEILEGEILERKILEGETLEGEILEGEILEGEILEGEILGGKTLEGEILEEEILEKETLEKVLSEKKTIINKPDVIYTKSYEEAFQALAEGKTVLLTPYLSDMDFECPNLSNRNVFWNAQMGPRWSRGQGIVVDTTHPVFRYFPTEHSGGWEWDEILDSARGFYFPAKYPNIVRVIDDWNRNYPLSLLFEGKVLNGKLLFAAADLSGDFETRPAAVTLREALLKYAASEEFCPEEEIALSDLQAHLRPLYRGSDIIRKVTINGEEREDCINCYDINPNIVFCYRPERLPVVFKIELARPVRWKRLSYLPIQNDREFPGVIRNYRIQAEDTVLSGEWKNGFETQWTDTADVTTDSLTLTVLSTYSMGEAVRFTEDKDGWHRVRKIEELMVSVAAFGVEYEEIEEAREEDIYKAAEPVRHDDRHFWGSPAKSRFKEIDI